MPEAFKFSLEIFELSTNPRKKIAWHLFVIWVSELDRF